MREPQIAVLNVDYIDNFSSQQSGRITVPAGATSANVPFPVPTILPNLERKEWRYVAYQLELTADSKDRHEIYVGHLVWIPPHNPKDFVNGVFRKPPLLHLGIFQKEILKVYTLNPFLSLIAWWRGKNVAELSSLSRFFADIVCMAGFSGWLSVRLFAEENLARWLVPTILIGLVGVGYAFSSIKKGLTRHTGLTASEKDN